MMRARVDLYLHGLFISKKFLGGNFHKNILPRAINREYYERNLKKLLEVHIMIMMIITAMASFFALNYFDAKEERVETYEIIDNYDEDNEN